MKSEKRRRATEKKEKAFCEFSTGNYTQREVANKYQVPEWELSKYISQKLSLSGYPGFKFNQ